MYDYSFYDCTIIVFPFVVLKERTSNLLIFSALLLVAIFPITNLNQLKIWKSQRSKVKEKSRKNLMLSGNYNRYFYGISLLFPYQAPRYAPASDTQMQRTLPDSKRRPVLSCSSFSISHFEVDGKMILCSLIVVLCYFFLFFFSIFLTISRKTEHFCRFYVKKDNISYFCCNFAADITLLYNNLK